MSSTPNVAPRIRNDVLHGFQEDVRSRLLRTRPPAQALTWVEATLRRKGDAAER